jgi:predicted metalloprotease
VYVSFVFFWLFISIRVGDIWPIKIEPSKNLISKTKRTYFKEKILLYRNLNKYYLFSF